MPDFAALIQQMNQQQGSAGGMQPQNESAKLSWCIAAFIRPAPGKNLLDTLALRQARGRPPEASKIILPGTCPTKIATAQGTERDHTDGLRAVQPDSDCL